MANPQPTPRARRWVETGLLAGLAAAAWAGNLVHLPMAYGLDLVFGSVFSMLALRWRGTAAGVLTAAAGGAYTLVLWHHPYAWFIIVAEALTVGLLRERLRPRGALLPLAALDALYWIGLGMPLVALCYGGLLGMDATEVLLVALKQAINGVFNAALAEALAITFQWLHRRPADLAFRDLLFITLVLAVLTPALAVSVWQIQRLTAAMEREADDLLTLAVRLGGSQLMAMDPPPSPAAATAALPALAARLSDLLPRVRGVRLDLITDPAASVAPAHGTRETVLARPPGNLMVHLIDRPGDSRMVRWRKGHFVMETPLVLAGQSVRLVTALPAGPAVEALQGVQLGVFWRLGLIMLLALVGADLLSRWVSQPLAALAEAARHLPARLDRAEAMAPASASRLREIVDLNAAFARMESALRENFTALTQDITERQHAAAARAAAELALQRYSTELETFSRILTRPQPTALDFTELLEFCGRCLDIGYVLLAERRGDRYRLLAATGALDLGAERDFPLGDDRFPATGCRIEPEPQALRHPVLGTALKFLVRVALTWTDPDNQVHHGVLDLAERHRSRTCADPQQQLLQLVAQRIGADLREQAVLDSLLKARQREVIGHLAGGVAHDFNNVLGAVGSNLQFLTELLPPDPRGSEAREVLNETQDAIGQAKVVTSGLLSLGRGEDHSAVPCDLSALVEAFAPLLRRLLPPGIELGLDLEPGVRALVNPALLQAAVLNLALNGRDAMGARGHLTLSVKARREAAPPPADLGDLGPAERAELAVRDTGAGMSAVVRQHIFEPLFSTKPHGRGTGLGLFMVREFALRSQGAIRVESVPGAGTCFRLWLPLLAPAPAPLEPVVHTLGEALPTPPAAPGTALCILLVDDDRRILNALSRVLAAAGYRVVTAVDGSDALDRLSATPDVSLVLSDIAMPRMDGLALYGALCCERPELPVILMSGDPAATRDAAAMDPGARVLRKPIDQPALVALIGAVLGDAPHSRP